MDEIPERVSIWNNFEDGSSEVGAQADMFSFWKNSQIKILKQTALNMPSCKYSQMC